MIFVGNRRAEQRQDAIAHGLGDVALVAVHGVHHELQSRIDDAARLFGIEVFQQGHGALDVGKQHGDLFALAFQGGA